MKMPSLTLEGILVPHVSARFQGEICKLSLGTSRARAGIQKHQRNSLKKGCAGDIPVERKYLTLATIFQ